MKIHKVFSSLEKKNDYHEHVQMKINSSFVISWSSNSSCLHRIFASSSSSSQPCYVVLKI